MPSDVHAQHAGDSTIPDPPSAGTGVLHQDVGCPGCGYNLRGLGGDQVVCPECGMRSDVGWLLMRRWDKPWYKAPRFNTLCSPAAVVFTTVLGSLLTFVALETFQISAEDHRWIVLSWVLIGLVGWFFAMVWIGRRMAGWVSVGFSLLAHLPIVGYLGGLIVFVVGLTITLNWIMDIGSGYPKPEVWTLLIGCGLLVGGIVLFVVGRWMERMVAGHCIRLYLRRPTTSD